MDIKSSEVDVQEQERYAKKIDLNQPTLEPYGGKFLGRGGNSECLAGSWNRLRLVIVEFPDVENARQWWASEVYRPAKQLRQETTDTNMILVDGV